MKKQHEIIKRKILSLLGKYIKNLRSDFMNAPVAACYASNCRFNQSMRCHAKKIEVDPTSDEAFCSTFEEVV